MKLSISVINVANDTLSSYLAYTNIEILGIKRVDTRMFCTAIPDIPRALHYFNAYVLAYMNRGVFIEHLITPDYLGLMIGICTSEGMDFATLS